MQLPKRKPGKYTSTPQDPLITQKKLEELQLEVDKLYKKRPSAAQEVSRLAQLGDFSENAEYQAAKRRLRGINAAITRLEYQINTAQIITSSNSESIEIGSTVTLETADQEYTYTILGSAEADPTKGIISHSSPIGSALLGKKKGDMISVSLPNGIVEYTIVKIS